MVRAVSGVAPVEAAVRAARVGVRGGKMLVALAQKPQCGRPYSLPPARPRQPRHRDHRRDGCASQAPSHVPHVRSVLWAILWFLHRQCQLRGTCRRSPNARHPSADRALRLASFSRCLCALCHPCHDCLSCPLYKPLDLGLLEYVTSYNSSL